MSAYTPIHNSTYTARTTMTTPESYQAYLYGRYPQAYTQVYTQPDTQVYLYYTYPKAYLIPESTYVAPTPKRTTKSTLNNKPKSIFVGN